ncbi:unnamed protein product [Schistocephalus solidus]|uniref:HECT domain-containing protein n=1 Tax=Schistocephalus solidus TaxID=70667 RepID=A0A183SIF1_SCHSO|nr:unnamed protein product [Schistocephalus solidus]
MEHLSSDSQLKNVRHHPNYLPASKQVFKHNFDSQAYCRYIPASRRSQSLWVQPFKFHATAIGGAAGAVQIAALNALKVNIYDLLQVPFRDLSADVCTSFRRSLNLLIECLLLALCAELTTIQLLALQCLQGLFRLSAHFEEKQGTMKLFANALTARGLIASVREDVRLACLRNLPLMFIPEGFAGDRPNSRFVAAFDTLLSSVLRFDTHASLAAVTFRELLVLLDPTISMQIIERWRTECPELVASARSFCEQVMDDLISKIPAPSLGSAVCATPLKHCESPKGKEAEDEAEEMGISCEDEKEETDSTSIASLSSSGLEYPSESLWSHYRFSYSDISFLLSRAQFEALTGCLNYFKDSRGVDCGRARPTSKELASSFIDSVSTFLSSDQHCNTVFLRVKVPSCPNEQQTHRSNKKTDQEVKEEELLLRTPRLTALCALLQLLLLDSNFNLVLLSLSALTRLLDAVRQQQHQSMTREQMTNLLRTNDGGTAPQYHRTDGYAWLSHHCVACLRTALADAKVVVRVEGSRLAAALTRLPGGSMALARELTAPLLAPNLEQTAQQRSPVGSRLRQEAFDALTVAILSDIADSELDLEDICQTVLVPGLLDEKQLVRDAAIDCLEAVAYRLGDSKLHSAYAAISSAEDRLLASLRVSNLPGRTQTETNNNNSLPDTEAGRCAVEERESLAIQQEVLAFFDVVRARVHRRILPKQDSQGRIVRPNSSTNAASSPSALSARMCAAEASAARGAAETVEYAAVALAGESLHL